MKRRALIALGSNIDPERNLPAAAARLAAHPDIEVLAASGVYESPPLGRPGDPCFHNAAVAVETSLAPAALRAELRRLEAEMGRVRGADRYAPRPIDLDLVAYEGFSGEVEGSRVPDPEVSQRAFLALPLAEVAPGWMDPALGRSLGEIAASFNAARERVRRLPDDGLASRRGT
ncbi:MAG TPA: 2-amino-4-hydroxy-6-hydroxymethyldihydropteridine diphosphokinase [Acidimicrobiia bacterium]|nr:2-amino-4-hydroxy-6-hydroxymethyldihydropteridine diphosphokinase [Acidimicrobiia bacterium]